MNTYEIKELAEAYAEKYRLVVEEEGWFAAKVRDYTNGFNACLKLMSTRMPEHPWLLKEDLDFALLLWKEEGKLSGVKFLTEKARPHSVTPLRTAKEILDQFSNQI